MKFTKTIATILLALIVPAVSFSAPRKAVKKKNATTRTVSTPAAKTIHGVSASDVLQSNKEQGFGRVVSLKDYESIANTFRQRGWEVSESSKWEDVCGEMMQLPNFVISKSDENGLTNLNLGNVRDFDGIMIIFPNSADATKFVNSCKAFGCKMRNGELTGGPSDCYWNGCVITQRDYQVWIASVGEC